MLTFIFTILSALYDNSKRFKNHIPRFIFRAITVMLISYFTNTNLILNISIFYFFFDYTLNVLEGRKWNYIGGVALHDILWAKYLGGWIPQLITKILLLCLGIYLQYL